MAGRAVGDQPHVPEHISPDETMDALIFSSLCTHRHLSKKKWILLKNEINVIRQDIVALMRRCRNRDGASGLQPEHLTNPMIHGVS